MRVAFAVPCAKFLKAVAEGRFHPTPAQIGSCNMSIVDMALVSTPWVHRLVSNINDCNLEEQDKGDNVTFNRVHRLVSNIGDCNLARTYRAWEKTNPGSF